MRPPERLTYIQRGIWKHTILVNICLTIFFLIPRSPRPPVSGNPNDVYLLFVENTTVYLTLYLHSICTLYVHGKHYYRLLSEYMNANGFSTIITCRH